MANPASTDNGQWLELALSDEDILDAMAHLPGYIDISTEDFRAIYHLAWQHALHRLQGTTPAVPEEENKA